MNILVDYPKKSYKCTIFLSMIYICILFCSAIIANKVIVTSFGSFSAGSLTGPFWFILSDIIAEVYGYKISKNIFLSAMVCEFIFVCISTILIHMPSPIWWHDQKSYSLIIDPLIQTYFFQLVGIIIAWHLNIITIIRWKVLLQGRYFWLRSIGASGISEIIFSLISVSLGMVGIVPLDKLAHIVMWSCIFKITFSIIFAYPAVIIVQILKNIEQIDIYEYSINIFSFKNLQKIKHHEFIE